MKERKERFVVMLGEKGTFIKEQSGSELEKETEDFERWIHDGPAAATTAAQAQPESAADANDADEVMGGT